MRFFDYKDEKKILFCFFNSHRKLKISIWVASILGDTAKDSLLSIICEKKVVLGLIILNTRTLRQMLCGSHIKIWNLASHMKKQTKNIKTLDLLVKNWKLRVRCSLFHFFMWFVRFQILVCEPQTIWRKLLVLIWFYC